MVRPRAAQYGWRSALCRHCIMTLRLWLAQRVGNPWQAVLQRRVQSTQASTSIPLDSGPDDCALCAFHGGGVRGFSRVARRYAVNSRKRIVVRVPNTMVMSRTNAPMPRKTVRNEEADGAEAGMAPFYGMAHTASIRPVVFPRRHAYLAMGVLNFCGTCTL